MPRARPRRSSASRTKLSLLIGSIKYRHGHVPVAPQLEDLVRTSLIMPKVELVNWIDQIPPRARPRPRHPMRNRFQSTPLSLSTLSTSTSPTLYRYVRVCVCVYVCVCCPRSCPRPRPHGPCPRPSHCFQRPAADAAARVTSHAGARLPMRSSSAACRPRETVTSSPLAYKDTRETVTTSPIQRHARDGHVLTHTKTREGRPRTRPYKETRETVTNSPI